MTYNIDAYLIPSKEYIQAMTIGGIEESIHIWKNNGIARYFACREVKPQDRVYQLVIQPTIVSIDTAVFETDRDLPFKKDDIILVAWGRYKITATNASRERVIRNGFYVENVRQILTAVLQK
jgi:hypothetical protein